MGWSAAVRRTRRDLGRPERARHTRDLVGARSRLLVVVAGRRGRAAGAGQALGPRGHQPRVAALAVAGTRARAALLAGGPARELVRWMVETVPGGGLLRDAQKYAARWALLVACCLGGAVDAGGRPPRGGPARSSACPRRWSRWRSPDRCCCRTRPAATWPTVHPGRLAGGFGDRSGRRARRGRGDRPGGDAAVARPTAASTWGTRADRPPTRRCGCSTAPVVVRDDLVVGDLVVAGESELAAGLAALLAQVPSRPVALRRDGDRLGRGLSGRPGRPTASTSPGCELRGGEPPRSRLYEVRDADPARRHRRRGPARDRAWRGDVARGARA